VSVSVALLLAVFGSVVPAGAATVAVLASDPVAVTASVAVTLKVALPPLGSVTVRLVMFPVPVAVPQAEPAEAVHVQATPLSPAGIGSLTTALVAVLGPAFETTML